MSDLTATNCGCGNSGLSTNGFGGFGNCTWIILLLLFCGNGNDCGGGFSFLNNNGCGCGGNNCCEWIIWLLLLSSCCGNN